MADPGLDAERLRKVVRFARRLALEHDPEVVRSAVVQFTLEVITGDAALLVERSPTGELHTLAHFGTALKGHEGAVLAVANKAIGAGRTVLHQPDPGRRAARPELGRIAAAPLRLGGRRGALVLTRLFTAAELHQHSVRALHLLASMSSETLRRSEAERYQRAWRNHVDAWGAVASRGVVLVDEEKRVLQANERAARLLRSTTAELNGRALAELEHGRILLAALGEGSGQREKPIKLGRKALTLRIRPHRCGAVLLLQEGGTTGASRHQTRYGFDDIITQDPAVLRTLEAARQTAQSTVSILITGESGTGKEVLAQAIHSASPRADEPFVAVNVAAIPGELLESELFGYESGAFTGARERGKPGAFELAGKGTLLLDEIGEMPTEMQAKLLRVLQEKQVQRLGGTVPIPVDARVLATTNRDLQQRVTAGRFRLDLYYRLRVVSLELPSLKERRGDIPLLAQHFIRQICTQLERPLVELAPQVVDQLVHHPWPGNIRELSNLLLGVISLLPEHVRTIDELPVFLSRPELTPLAAPPRNPPAAAARMGPPIREDSSPSHPLMKALEGAGGDEPVRSLAEAEQAAIEAALAHTDRNLSKTARILGISRTTLYKKLDDYGLRN